MPWWGWMAVGALLLVAELTFVDLEFYLVFLGLSALITGMLELAGIALPFGCSGWSSAHSRSVRS